ncbi:major facilitator superfamily domain-containing protein [Mycena crocata]|nr:major facilitator superfamily domain-containing protein [Mycena crocata]
MISNVLAFCFLNRVNLGFASLAGLQKSLGLHGIQYNIGLTCFYTTYVVVETPNNLLGKHFGMGRWLAGCAFGFGICCMCSAFVRNFGKFCFVHALLGIFEGGMLPGIAFLLSKFYRRQELTYRLGLVLASSVGAASGGLIAPSVLKIAHVGWLTTWRNVSTQQLIEGLITTIMAICVFFLIVDSPAQASWLTKEETMLAVSRLEAEYPAVTEAAHHIRTRTFRQGLFNVNVSPPGRSLVVCLNVVLADLADSAVFLPTVVATLFPTKTTIESQLLSVPPYCMAAVVQIIVPYISMRMDTCGPFMAVLAGVGVIGTAHFVLCGFVLIIPLTGYAIFVGANSLHTRYATCFLVAAGAFPFGVFCLGLVAVNTGSDATRAVALGVLSSVGYIGGIITSAPSICST